ncbi:MAG: dienelactone hydrolase family protein [Gemmatimonadetes bacterium]|nr:dienelactone hydrolase family protein [Gemmatimonadota bacterium]
MTLPPHGAAQLFRAGAVGTAVRGRLIMLHGRGATADGIASLAAPLGVLDRWSVVAPQAAGNTWYPYSFLAPMAQNEPGITSGIALIESLVQSALDEGFRSDQVALLGFSQGACLSLEFVARHPRRYAAVIGYSGGLIGPPGTPRDYAGSLDGTPVFLGCSDVDAHIPAERVRESAEVLSRMGASVDMRFYPGMPHTVNDEELAAGRELLR